MAERRYRLKQAFPQSPTLPFRLCEKTDSLSSAAEFPSQSRLARDWHPDERQSPVFYGFGSEIDLGLMGREEQGTLQTARRFLESQRGCPPHRGVSATGANLTILGGNPSIFQRVKGLIEPTLG
jgi:hypothetical protein